MLQLVGKQARFWQVFEEAPDQFLILILKSKQRDVLLFLCQIKKRETCDECCSVTSLVNLELRLLAK